MSIVRSALSYLVDLVREAQASSNTDDFLRRDLTWAAPPGGVWGGAPTNAQYLVVALNGTLSAERRLQVGTGLSVSDGGANADLTISPSGSLAQIAAGTWPGSSSITTLGTIGTGTWQGTAVADSYIASAATWNAKEPGIAAGTTSQYWRGDKSWQTLDKAAVGLGNVENTALSTWGGSTNITQTGTIASGTWSATTIAVDKGGTGLTSYTQGDLLYATGATTLAKLAKGTGLQELRMNAGATAPEWFTPASSGGDVVYAPTPGDTAINNVADVTIVTRNVTGVVAGDQVIIEGAFIILNNSGATRVYVITLDFDGAFDIEISTGALATSATLMHPFFFQAYCNVRAANLAYALINVENQLAAGVASGGDTTQAATHLHGKGWGSTTNDLTGTLTCTLAIRSANATATQTCRLVNFVIRKVSPT